MRFLTVIPLLVLSLNMVAQNAVTDTSVTMISFWNKGETRTLSVQVLKEKYEADKKTSGNLFRYIATVTVLDSTSDGYSMQWALDLPESMKKANPKLAEQLPVFSGMKINFRIEETGEFAELINWKDVRDAYVRMLEFSMPAKMDDTMKLVFEKTKQMFDSKDMVESSMIKDIKLYHVPYGLNYPREPFTVSAELENPLGGPPVPSTQKISVTEVNEEKGYFNLVIDETLDPIKMKGMVDGIVGSMGLDSLKISKEREDLSGFINSSRHSEYQVDLKTGWIRKMFYKSTSRAGDSKQIESYLIELKK